MGFGIHEKLMTVQKAFMANLSFKYHALIGGRNVCQISNKVLQRRDSHAAFNLHVERGSRSKFESDLDHTG
jgi:deoxyxylulose-5-phosphate synthase